MCTNLCIRAGINAASFSTRRSVAGLISDSTGRPASTCSLMLITAVPCMFLYQWLEDRGCRISSDHGVPVHNTCFTLSILVTLVTGVLVNGPYALITTAVSAELGKYLSNWCQDVIRNLTSPGPKSESQRSVSFL